MQRTSISIAVTLCVSFLAAHPGGHEVAHGSADVKALENLLQITTSDKAILNWKEFSSKAGETIRFVQPNATSAVLNRVTGGNTSTLYGDLQANGQVYLVNQNGIVIGQNARIDAGAFTASTFDVLDSDFIEGSALRFFGDSKAGVVNLGMIKTASGDCSLISFQVENDGSIDAAGEASLVASNKVILKPHELARIYIASDQDISYVDNPYLLAFNQTIEKDALHFAKTEDGVFLTVDAPVATVAGFISAESVMVLGDFVQILKSGDIEGDSILIGGDYQGKNDSLVNARMTYVDKEASLNADGLDGGRIILWSDEATGMYGSISAQPKGFVEISSHGFLAADGPVDTGGGTLLLDPVDVTIGAANANITFPLAAPCTGFPNPINYTYTQPATISAASLAGYLACNDVVVATNQAGAGTGNITVTNAVNWSSAFGLTLDTTGTTGGITVNNSIQNDGAGPVILKSDTGTINLTTPAATVAIIGSKNGLTQVNAPNANLNIISTNGATGIGFRFLVSGDTANGNIDVSCAALNMQASNTVATAGAKIGHGSIIAALNDRVFGNITVNSVGSISMQGGAPSGSNPAVIGHGNLSALGVIADITLTGNITVTSQTGNITMTAPLTANPGSKVVIGHGFTSPIVGMLGTWSGNISVTAPLGTISLQSGGGALNDVAAIGHGSWAGVPGGTFPSASGDIDVGCQNLTLSASNSNAIIGHTLLGPNGFTTISGTYRVSVINDLTINGLNSSNFIGTLDANPSVRTGDTIVAVGQDINMAWTPPSNAATFASAIVVRTAAGGASTGNVFVVAQRNINMTMPVGAGCEMAIEGPSTVSVAAGGNITLNQDGGIHIAIGANNPVSSIGRIYAGGNILADNSATGTATLGGGVLTLGNSVDVRAAGDVQFARSFTTTNGFVFVEADSNLSTGGLWTTSSPGVLTSICGQATAITNSAFGASSAAVPANGIGAFRTDPSPNATQVSFITTTGDITVHSGETRVLDGLPQNLNISNVVTDLNIATTSGNITISGSVPADSFHNVNINAVANPWTTGNIYVAANNDINEATQVVNGGAGKSISLIADQDNSGIGNLNLTQNITSNAGPILLQAGFGAASGASAINQTAAQVNSNGGTITAQAVGNVNITAGASMPAFTSGAGNQLIESKTANVNVDEVVSATSGTIFMKADAGNINILTTGQALTTTGGIDLDAAQNINLNGLATTLSSTSGTVHTLAGIDTNVTTNVATAGSITMISGHSMFLLAPTTNITSLGSFVDLVTDNDFPSPPGIGPGFFSSVAGSQVNAAGALRIFTALQGQNSILGTLNGATFTAGTIFQDSAAEHWCTYYPSPFFGGVFTVFYKDCQAIIVQTGNKVVSDMLFNLNTENMWVEELLSPLIPPEVWRFMIIYDKGVNALTHFAHERYWLSRRSIRFIHYPYVYKENKPLAELVPAEVVARAPQDKKRRI